jgi:hypothetical protein|tara:strand:- start:249 stop:1211 length:963 start_codon:yes stop_codon:yes gene_type:complete
MKIEQFHLGDWGHYIKDDPYVKDITRNRCIPYNDPSKPAFFLSSTYTSYILDNHLGPAIIIMNNNPWPLEDHIDRVRGRDNIFFISSSAIMSNYLDKLQLKYVEFPWELEDRSSWAAVTKGACVYVYGEGPKQNMYGWPAIQRIMTTHFPYIPVICTSHKKSIKDDPPFKYYTNDQLEDVYKKCFLGIRLTRFDGLSGTVQDLGCKGIKTIWNGGSPSALPYATEAEIIYHIKNEEKTIGQKNEAVSDATKSFLNMDKKEYDYIFNLETYKNNVAGISAPVLFNNPYKIPATLFKDLVDNRHALDAPSSWKDDNGIPRWH